MILLLLLLVHHDVVDRLSRPIGAGSRHGHRLPITRDDPFVLLNDLACLLAIAFDGAAAAFERDRVVIGRSRDRVVLAIKAIRVVGVRRRSGCRDALDRDVDHVAFGLDYDGRALWAWPRRILGLLRVE